MEESRHSGPASHWLAYRDVRSCLPRRGATSHVPSRWGPGRQGHEGESVSHPLPTIQCLAKEMCARRGFDITTHGSLPSSGTILSIDEFTFDRAIVLLTLFPDARAYADRAFEASEPCVRSLSLRVSSCIANRPALAAVVSDLAHDRMVIMSATHGEAIRQARHLLTPMRRARVEFGSAGAVRVLVEAQRGELQLVA